MNKLELQKNSIVSSSKYYWTDDVDNYILIYITASQEHKNSIFEKHIYDKFRTLAENIVNTYKFNEKCDDSFHDIVDECVTFLFTKIGKFNGEKGKGFSYFSIVCKNFLIQKSNRYLKNQPLKIYFNSSNDNDEFDDEIFVEAETEDFDKNIRLEKMIECIEQFMNSSKCNDKDRLVCNSVIEIIKNNESIDIIGIQTIYLIIEEMTNLNRSYVYRSLRKINDNAYKNYKIWNEDD